MTRRIEKTQPRFVIGVDFGTLSARAVLVDLRDGHEVASAVHEYADGVISSHLPGQKRRLPPDTSLQNPADHLRALSAVIPAVLRRSRTKPEQIVALGTDFTSCTMLPT